MQRHLRFVVLLLLLAATAWPAAPVAAQDEPAAPAITTDDPAIAPIALEWRLMPLRKAGLEGEAEAWLGLLQAKVKEIADVEIQAMSAEGASKTQLLERASVLTEERTALIDRVQIVLDALEKKGGDVDEHRRYVAQVSGLKVELTDAGAALATLRNWLESREGGIRWGKNILGALATLIAAWIIARILGGLVRRALARFERTSVLLRDFLVNITRKATMIVGLVVAAGMLEINIGPLVAAIGATGFILAFALQDTLGNLAAGLMILMYRPFDVGDVVNVAGTAGKVKEMSLSSTTVTTPDNQLVIVPNKTIWGNVITNITGSTTRRVDLVFGIGYDDDVEQARTILQEVATSHPAVLADPETTVQLNELADSSVNFVVRPWARTEDYWTVYWDVTRTVKQRFDAAGISIPYPQRDVHVYQHSAAAAPA